jgi:hypothetical protein
MTRPQSTRLSLENKKEDTPVSKEGSDRSNKMTILLLICLKRLIKKSPALTAAYLNLSLTELSSISELSIQYHLHTALYLPFKRTKDFLAKQPSPGHLKADNSLDLKIIENMWNFIKGKLKEKDNSSLSLIKKIKLLGTTSITQDYCKRLSNSMPRRIQQVMAAKKRPPSTEDMFEICKNM